MRPEQDDADSLPRRGAAGMEQAADGTEQVTDGTEQAADGFEVDEEVQHALDRLTLLINAAEALSSTLDVDQGLRRLCRTIIPGLADWCAVDLLDDRGRLRRLVVEHRDADVTSPGLDEGLLPAAEGSAASVARALLGVGPVLLTDIPRRRTRTTPCTPGRRNSSSGSRPIRRWSPR